MKTFEVEGLEEKGEDSLFDIKILPDRSPYCLSHRYIAQEIGAIIRQEMVLPETSDVKVTDTKRKVSIKIENEELCSRYMGRVVENVNIAPSPKWLKDQLEVLGQRSINNIVDYSNFVMLEIGQPMHAFDADKVEGDINVRLAKEGEEIVILDGTTVKLAPSMLVIADSVGPLAIAGVKGGKRAEISTSTKNIIIEAANFKGSSVRRTSQVTGIRNDSSKRFENQVTAERAEIAMKMMCDAVAKENPSVSFGEIVDIYPKPVVERNIEVSVNKINSALGCEISADEMVDILNWCKINTMKNGDVLTLQIPTYRTDISAIEDVVDEVVRLYGYERVPVKIPGQVEVKINKSFHYKNLIRKILVEKGFSEIYTYTLKEGGDMVLENPLNIERGTLRNDLSSTLAEKLEFNLRNAELLGQKNIKIFEIGNVFASMREHSSLAVGIAQPKSVKGESVNEQIRNLREELILALGIKIQTVCTIDDTGGIIILNNKPIGDINKIDGVMEIDLDKVIEALPEPVGTVELPPLSNTTFKKISPYPFMVRDIAVFVPGEAGGESEVLDIIKKHGTELLVRTDLFDTFTKKKEGEPTKTSYAYRMIYQADNRTLTDDEINVIMKNITDDMNAKDGWQVR